VIIYRIEEIFPWNERLAQRLRAAQDEHGVVSLAVSRLSVLECRVKPMRESDEALLARYHEFFAAPDLNIVELDANVVEGATRIRALTGLRTPDALQTASCLAFDREALFLTGDAAVRRVPGLRVETL
jgi:predicted nucleic acid-binding protein